MFKSKASISVMLAGVVGGYLFVRVCEYLQGREACVVWAYLTFMGLGVLLFVLVLRRGKGDNSEK